MTRVGGPKHLGGSATTINQYHTQVLHLLFDDFVNSHIFLLFTSS